MAGLPFLQSGRGYLGEDLLGLDDPLKDYSQLLATPQGDPESGGGKGLSMLGTALGEKSGETGIDGSTIRPAAQGLDQPSFPKSNFLQNFARSWSDIRVGTNLQAQQKAQQKKKQRERRVAMAEDSATALTKLDNGDVQGAIDFGVNRIENIQALGGNPSDTFMMVAGLEQGNISEVQEVLKKHVLEEQRNKILRRDDPSLNRLSGFENIETAKIEQAKVSSFRADIMNISKDQRKVNAAYNRIQSVGSQATPAGDLSLIFGIMKMNDPTSTVRESEYATAENAGAAFDRWGNTYNRVLSGEKLTVKQRADFLNTAEGLHKGQRKATDTQIGNILEQADQDYIPRVRVMGKTRLTDWDQRMADYKRDKNPVTEVREITTQAEFDSLPPGAKYFEDGKEFTK